MHYKNKIKRYFIIAFLFAVLIAGCATGSYILTGKQRPPIDPKEVKVLLQAPSVCEVIGIVEARSLSGWTDQDKMNHVVEELKAQAASIGANAIVLNQAGTQVTSGGTYVGQTYGTTSTGMIIPYQVAQKSLSATAIYIKE